MEEHIGSAARSDPTGLGVEQLLCVTIDREEMSAIHGNDHCIADLRDENSCSIVLEL